MNSALAELQFFRTVQKKHPDLLEIMLKMTNEKVPQVSQQYISKLQNEFPLKSIDEFLHFESLLTNKENEKALLVNIKRIGGNSAADQTRRILRHLISDSVAEQYCWLGNKDKRKFESLQLCRIIMDVVMDTDTAVSYVQVENVIKSWLRHAKGRRIYVSQKKST